MHGDARDLSYRLHLMVRRAETIPSRRNLVSFMSRSRRSLSIALVGLLVASATVSATADLSRGFIWRVERDGRIGWVVGSIHVLSPDYYPLPDSMEKAYLRAATLVEEIDLAEAQSPEIVALVGSLATYSGAETLKSELSPETYRMLSDRLTTAGASIEPFERMRPWFLTVTVMAAQLRSAGFDPALGLDRHFFDKNARMGKQFRSLETAAEQIKMLSGLPPKVQEGMLRETMETNDAIVTQMDKVGKAWRAGDITALEQIVLKPMKDQPEVYESLVVGRNRNWIPKIESCLGEGHCFVVVGAAHLVGPEGVLALLQQKGYTIQQE
jgi:uncharacterized protein YbaP (TraB family)